MLADLAFAQFHLRRRTTFDKGKLCLLREQRSVE